MATLRPADVSSPVPVPLAEALTHCRAGTVAAVCPLDICDQISSTGQMLSMASAAAVSLPESTGAAP